MLGLIISLGLAYLIGSIPTSFIFTKILKNTDIRQHGSGNVGATNVFRVAGKLPAVIVLAIDIFKGAFVVIFLPNFFFNNAIGVTLGAELYTILLGVFVIGGHVWSVFLRFSGGKGVATTAGVLLGLAPKILAGSTIMWVFVFFVFHIVSIASIVAGIFLPIFALLFGESFFLVLFCVFLCIMDAYKHKANIKRLLRSEEKKLF